jgi:hypothetical protein
MTSPAEPLPEAELTEGTQRSARVQAEMRKRWIYILPAVFVTYSLAYVDRANYGFGAAAGLDTTLHISDSRSALLGALFFSDIFCFKFRAPPTHGRGARVSLCSSPS